MMLFKFALFTSSKVGLNVFCLKVIKPQLLIAFLIATALGGAAVSTVNHAPSARTTPALAAFPESGTSGGPSIGENIFRAKCAVCHGVDGSGKTLNGKKFKVPDLRSEKIQHHDDEELLDVVTNGKGDMPPFGKKYNPDKLQQVVAYVRSLGQKN